MRKRAASVALGSGYADGGTLERSTPLPCWVASGPPDLERRKRYLRQGPIDARDPLADVRSEIEGGGKVLWVCNTVRRVMAAADRAKSMTTTSKTRGLPREGPKRLALYFTSRPLGFQGPHM